MAILQATYSNVFSGTEPLVFCFKFHLSWSRNVIGLDNPCDLIGHFDKWIHYKLLGNLNWPSELWNNSPECRNHTEPLYRFTTSITVYTRATFETPKYLRRPWDQYATPNNKCIEADPPPPTPPHPTLTPLLWWTPSAKRKYHHSVSSGWSSTWFHSSTGLYSTQYEQIPIIFGVWPFSLTHFFFGQ